MTMVMLAPQQQEHNPDRDESNEVELSPAQRMQELAGSGHVNGRIRNGCAAVFRARIQ